MQRRGDLLDLKSEYGLFADEIKVVVDGNSDALYFSRSPIPSFAKCDAPSSFGHKQVCVIPFRREALLNVETVFMDSTALYVMPEERSIDIDSELDFKFVEFMFSNKKNQN